jgi:hypothetical protein
MSFYYQSTIIYFVVFGLYLVIRGEFVEDSFKLITNDPVLYFLAIIVIISVLSLFYNLFKNKHIEIDDQGISFVNRFRIKTIKREQIKYIRLSKQRRTMHSRTFKTVKIKIDNRLRPIIIRLTDYENQDELLSRLEEIKINLENGSV